MVFFSSSCFPIVSFIKLEVKKLNNKDVPQMSVERTRESVRLHYIDWLRVLAIFGVFLYHAVHPFDLTYWHVKNNELSLELTIAIVFFSLWGMQLFFLLAGAGSWFALRHRSNQQYIEERVKRLLIPYIVGVILFTPIMLYLEWYFNTLKGSLTESFLEFILNRYAGFSPMWFGALGYHLWFLGFLFSFSILGLPLFLKLKGTSGKRVISWLAQISEYRGGLLIFILPLLLVQLIFRPFFPLEHDWADFFYQFSFFLIGFILFADERIIKNIRRDWLIFLIIALSSTIILLIMYEVGDPFAWSTNPGIPEFYLVYIFVTATTWCWINFILVIGMRFLDFSNTWLQYWKEAILPFYLVHQPIILIIAFFVVQWDASILIKLPVVVLSSFIFSLAFFEFIIKRIRFLQPFFGIKVKKIDKTFS